MADAACVVYGQRQLRSAEQRVKDLEITCEEQEAEILRLREEVEEVEASNQHVRGLASGSVCECYVSAHVTAFPAWLTHWGHDSWSAC